MWCIISKYDDIARACCANGSLASLPSPTFYTGLTCDLVGFMASDDFSRCDDNSDLKSLAGYRYVTDQQIMNRASHIDVDMRKVEIFIENGVSHFPDSQEVLFGTAFDLYRYGQHSNDIKSSLSSMARDTNRDIVPLFGAFSRYFKSDENYADTMIVRAHRFCV